MNSFKQTEKDLTSQLSRENEQQTNRIVGLISLGLVCIVVVSWLFNKIYPSASVDIASVFVSLPLGAVLVIFYLTAWHFKFDAPWIKYMLVSGITLMTTAQFLCYTTFATYFVLLPLVISTRYFNKAFIAQTAVVSAALFAIACILNLHMADQWEILRIGQQSNIFDPWSDRKDALTYVIIPLGMMAVFIAAFCIELTKNGRALLKKQAQAACRVAVVDAELNMASEIQRSTLPAASFITPDCGFVIEAKEEPAREVGGDFYDYFMLNEHTLGVMIADVSDKGVPAAMFMMSAQKAIRCAVECCHSLDEAIALANRLICESNDSDMFITLWIGLIDTGTGVGKYANAGHNAPFIKTAEGEIKRLANDPDIFLGVFPEQSPAVHTFALKQGDMLLLYTDGVTDSMNAKGGCFGADGIEGSLNRCGPEAKQAVDMIMTDSAAFTEGMEQFDDMTLLALKCVSTEQMKRFSYETADFSGDTEPVLSGINGILSQVSCPDDVRRNADTVIDEICSNIGDYAYGGENGKLNVTAEAGMNVLRIRFSDEGEEFNPLQQQAPDFDGEPMIGGLGIHLVKNLTDSLSYQRVDNRNELTAEMIWGI